MELPTYFASFLQHIRPTANQQENCKVGHRTLRNRLENYEDLKSVIVSTFLQGSYRRATIVRPKGAANLDVDVITVTNLDRFRFPNPDDALDIFEPFLNDYYPGKYTRQGRSFGIELSYINIDLVITSAPSEVNKQIYESYAVKSDLTPDDDEDWYLALDWVPKSQRSLTSYVSSAAGTEWQTEPLWIPNRDAGAWERTHPIEQIKWTWRKNNACNRHYVNVVRAIKWWQRVNHENDIPNSYPLEHIIGVCCPDHINSVAEGVTSTLEAIASSYSRYAVPWLSDHGVPEHNVLSRVTNEEFASFHDHATNAARIARDAFDSNDKNDSIRKWRTLFGDEFPDSNNDEGSSDNRGPFIAPNTRNQTGDLTPRRYGKHPTL